MLPVGLTRVVTGDPVTDPSWLTETVVNYVITGLVKNTLFSACFHKIKFLHQSLYPWSLSQLDHRKKECVSDPTWVTTEGCERPWPSLVRLCEGGVAVAEGGYPLPRPGLP